MNALPNIEAPEDSAGEQFAPQPETRPSLEILARRVAEHPTLENVLALRRYFQRTISALILFIAVLTSSAIEARSSSPGELGASGERNFTPPPENRMHGLARGVQAETRIAVGAGSVGMQASRVYFPAQTKPECGGTGLSEKSARPDRRAGNYFNGAERKEAGLIRGKQPAITFPKILGLQPGASPISAAKKTWLLTDSPTLNTGHTEAVRAAGNNFDMRGVDGDTPRMYGAVRVTTLSRLDSNPKPVQFPHVGNVLPHKSKREASLGNGVGEAASYADGPQFRAKSISSRIDASVDPNARLMHTVKSPSSDESEPLPGCNFIDHLALIESNGKLEAIGDKGKARGAWQMTEAAWSDVNALRRRQQLPEFPWECAHNNEIAREYASQYLGILRRQFIRAVGKPPSERQLIGLYQHGFKGGQRRGFQFKERTAR